MNRSILIVICDFLLVTLLASSSVDISKLGEDTAPRNVAIAPTNQVEGGKDLAAMMRLALDEERQNRDRLLGELKRAQEAASRQQATLTDREKQMQALQQELQDREQQSQHLRELQAGLEQQYASAQTNLMTAQSNLMTLTEQLQNRSTDAKLAKEKLAAIQTELSNLQKTNQAVVAERQRLSTELQVAEVERRHAAEQVLTMKEQVKVEREEKARLAQQATELAEGVKALANKSGELAQEVHESRPLAPNAIFSDFATNRLAATFSALRPGFLGGESIKRRDNDMVLLTDGTNYFALSHVQETPLSLSNQGTDWDALTGMLSRYKASVPIRSLCFYLRDPRLVFIPLTQAEVQQLGAKAYRISSDPFKFQDAVLIGAHEGYYGECRFQIDLSTPDYVKLDSGFLRGLFGKFNPSRGDLVFSKTGEFLGVMANSTYCLMVRDFTPAASFRFGQDLRGQGTGIILAQLYSIVSGLPSKLQ